MQARHKGQIEAMQMRVLRRIEGVFRLDRVRNVDLGQIEAGGYSEEAAAELEAKEGDEYQQSD